MLIRLPKVRRLWHTFLTFALKIPYWMYLESQDISFKAKVMAFCLKVILIPASFIEKLITRKGIIT